MPYYPPSSGGGGDANTSGGNSWDGTQTFTEPTSGTTVFESFVTGDTDPRFVVYADGLAEWGDGSNPADANLYRDAVGVIKTDNSLEVGTDHTVGGDSNLFNTFVTGVTNHSALRLGNLGAPIAGAHLFDEDNDYVIQFDTTAPRTGTLPAAPSDGVVFGTGDGTGTASANNITIAGNGNTINGAASYTIVDDYGFVWLAFNDDTSDWQITAQTSSGGGSGDAMLSGGNAWDGSQTYEEAASGTTVFDTFVTGDADIRYSLKADGRSDWGDGTNPFDISEYRPSVGALTREGNDGSKFFLGHLVTGNAFNSFGINGDGGIAWSDGSFALSPGSRASFRYNGSGNLVFQSDFLAGNKIIFQSATNPDLVTIDGGSGRVTNAGSQGAYRATDLSAASSLFLASKETGVGSTQYSVNADGQTQWGSGTGGQDVFLYRTGAGAMQWDTDLLISGSSFLGDAVTDLVGLYGTAGAAQAAAITPAATQTGAYVQADVQSIADAVNFLLAALDSATGIGLTA